MIIQENRSFDNLFHDFPGANTVSSGQLSNGQTEPLRPMQMNIGFDINHGLGSFLNAYDGGKMDGFDLEPVEGHTRFKYPQYTYVPANETLLYRKLARTYVLADDMFASNLDASFVSHPVLHRRDRPSRRQYSAGDLGLRIRC